MDANKPQHRVIYLIEFNSPRRGLIVDGEVLHDAEEDVPEHIWFQAMQKIAPLAALDVKRVTEHEFNEELRHGTS